VQHRTKRLAAALVLANTAAACLVSSSSTGRSATPVRSPAAAPGSWGGSRYRPEPPSSIPRHPGELGSLSGLVNTDTYRVFAWGLVPVATGDGNCDWGPRYHGNMGDPEVPTASARWVVAYRNAGGTACALRQVTRVFID